jgi:Fe2+ transport system protein FeoA
MIFNFIAKRRPPSKHTLAGQPVGAHVLIDSFLASPRATEHLINLGLVPGVEIEVVRRSPAGDPRIYRIEGGTELALRRDLSAKIVVRPRLRREGTPA